MQRFTIGVTIIHHAMSGHCGDPTLEVQEDANGEWMRTVDFAPLVTLLRESKRLHTHCDDSWYCCGKCTHPDHGELDGHRGREADVCDCGADAWNTKVDAALAP